MKFYNKLLLLLVCFALLFVQFSTIANADNIENLIDSDLTNWVNETPDSCTVTSEFGLYRLLFKTQKLGDTSTNIRQGIIYDLTNLIAGNSYTLSFYLPSAQQLREISSSFTYSDSGYYDKFTRLNGTLIIGLQDQSTGIAYEDYSFVITQDNYLDYFGKSLELTFEMPSMKNPAIYIVYQDVHDSTSNHLLYLGDFSLVDNEAEKENNFLNRLFAWFQEKFVAIGESFTNLGNKLTDLKDSFINKITDLKDSFVNKIEELKQSFIDLKNDLLEGIKSLFVPDEDFMLSYSERWDSLMTSRFGAVFQVGNVITEFFESLISYSGEECNTINVPAITLPLPDNASFTFGGFDVVIVDERFQFLQNALKLLVGILSTFGFVYGLRKRYDEVMGVEH